MDRTPSLSKEVIKTLSNELKRLIPEVAAILDDFPEANETLKYPSISLMTGAPDFKPSTPYTLSKTAPDTNNKIKVKTVVGTFDFKIQLDIWTGNKFERNEMWERLFQAFNSQLPRLGLDAELENYHKNVFCHYTINNYKFDDSEASSQRKEWRVKVDILASTSGIIEQEEFAIITTQIINGNETGVTTTTDTLTE